MILTSVSVNFLDYTTGNPVFQDSDRFLPFFSCRFLPFFPCFFAFSTFRAAGPGPSTRSPANRRTPKPITAKRHGTGRTIPIPCRLCLFLRRCKQREARSFLPPCSSAQCAPSRPRKAQASAARATWPVPSGRTRVGAVLEYHRKRSWVFVLSNEIECSPLLSFVIVTYIRHPLMRSNFFL